MKKLLIVWSMLLALSTMGWAAAIDHSDVAGGCLEPLALPADKILRISKAEVEFEHHGYLPISSAVEAYQHWDDEIFPIPLDAVKVGFERVVPTLYEGEIVRFDVYDPLYIRTIRVAISTDQFAGIEHRELRFTPTSRLYVEEKGTGRGFVLKPGEEAVVTAQGGRFHVVDGQGSTWEFGPRIYVEADPGGLVQINSFKRGVGTRFYPQYRGRFELTVAEESFFLAINEVSLEEYLIQVVPSEMPISWPMEALKAQAVAARTFAVAQAVYSRQGHLGFHVADSTNSQVYNNEVESARTTQAILETAGQILVKPDGTVGSTYFYSTSPRAILTSQGSWQDLSQLALEGGSPWFRWKCSFSREELAKLLGYLLPTGFGEITALEVAERDELGRVVILRIVGTAGQVSISGELNVRRALQPASLERVRDKIGRQTLLPSASFFLDQVREAGGGLKAVHVYGGGAGHQLGMSQWGAKGMAESGYDYLSILREYYPDTHLITHSEQLRY
ncbi:SpoIID/LytB domain-containing protein [Candidatus Darwinibacter acetoxidans]